MAEINGVDLKELDSLFGGFPAGDAAPNKSASDKSKLLDGVNVDDLDKAFGNSGNAKVVIRTPSKDKIADPDVASVIANPNIASGVLQGLKDIPNSGAQLIGYIDSKLSDEGKKRYEDLNKRIKTENENFDAANPPSDTIIPTAASAGRVVGQALGTAPLMPVKAFQTINAFGKVLPYVGKPLSMMTTGAIGGGIFGAATNSTNDEGLASNVGTTSAYGAAAGPVAELGARAAGKALTSAKDIAASIKTNYILKNSGIDPNAARNTLARLTDAGYTPRQAHAELQRMGPDATIADLVPSLTTEAGGLAAKGGVPTDTLKNRFGERAANANSAAHDMMEQRLGAKPDYEAEKVAAKLDRQQQTSADYNKAKASNMALDVKPIVDKIAVDLQNAVGSEASRLHEIGSYLYDSKGNIKTDTAPLLKVRQAIDHDLKKMVKEGTTQESSTYRAVSGIRDDLNKVLKTNPDLAIADAKYAKLRQDFEGLDLGKKSITNTGNYSNFEREFTNASPEKQEFMRKGLRIQIGDQMEKATRGELSEAQRLFGKSTSNRKIIKLAFGSDGEEVLNALEKEAKFRGTEHKVSSNSETAARLAVQNRPEYGGARSGSILGDALTGAAIDASTGSLGAGTAVMAAKRTGGNLLSRLSDAKTARTVEGTADLLSRQSQHGRTTALDLLDSVGKIRSPNNPKLPVDYSGATRLVPLVIPSIKKGYQRINGISEQ